MTSETWDTIADWYADRLRAGSPIHDFARDILLDALPRNLDGQRMVDMGCGEGIITRALAARGAAVVGIDPSSRLIAHALGIEEAEPVGASYTIDDGCTLSTVADGSVDYVTAGLSLNNVPDLPAAVDSTGRVLVPGGRLVFTIPHPCFEAPRAKWVSAPDDRANRLVGEYFAEGFWRSDNPEGVRRAGNQHRTLSSYVMTLIRHGFTIEAMAEPAPDDRLKVQQPQRSGLPPFLVVGARRS